MFIFPFDLISNCSTVNMDYWYKNNNSKANMHAKCDSLEIPISGRSQRDLPFDWLGAAQDSPSFPESSPFLGR